MGVDTHGRLQGRILPEEVLNFIKQKYDDSAESYIEKHDYDTDDYKNTCFYGDIVFKDGEDKRSLFYSYDTINYCEGLEYYKQHGLEDMVKSQTTFISLGYFGNSVEIIKDIVTEFGGWIDENDCDDEEYYYIPKHNDHSINPIIKVTMQEIFEKFGGVVVITDR